VRIVVAGALGEVGGSLGAALIGLGHEVVPVSSRAPIDDRPAVLTLARAAELITDGSIDLVVNCGGRGDRRAIERSGMDGVDALPAACWEAGIPGILISTTRVLEGYDHDYSEDTAPDPRTDYATANAAHEEAWLTAGGSNVVRITNYFAAPQALDSPQSRLLPWSLVTEGLAAGRIGIRSGPSLVKEFVAARDVATAILTVADDPSAPVVCATVPGVPLTLRELADCCCTAFAETGRSRPDVAFGPDGPVGPACRPGWLATRGWMGSLTATRMEQEIAAWMVEWAPSAGR
jgi:nucleoside-diphosphate-sugar epimerase